MQPGDRAVMTGLSGMRPRTNPQNGLLIVWDVVMKSSSSIKELLPTFWVALLFVVEPRKIMFPNPKRRIESYSIMGTIVS